MTKAPAQEGLSRLETDGMKYPSYYNSDGSSTSGANRIDGGYPGWRP